MALACRAGACGRRRDSGRLSLVDPTKDELLDMAVKVAEQYPDVCPICFAASGVECRPLLHDLWTLIMDDGVTTP